MGNIISTNCWNRNANDEDSEVGKSLVLYVEGIHNTSDFSTIYVKEGISSGKKAYSILEPVKKQFEMLRGENLDFELYSIALEDLISEFRWYISGLTSPMYDNQAEVIKRAFEKQNENMFRVRCMHILEHEFPKND